LKKEKKIKDFLPAPEYPGGPKAMHQFIQHHLQYPPEAMPGKIEGIVVIRGEINHKGKVVHTKVISSLHPLCDAEAQRVIGMLEFLVDKIRNARVSYFKTFNIQFRLPKPPELNISYSFQPSHHASGPKVPPSNTIQYTIVVPKK